MQKLLGKVALLTGAASGIGKECAIDLAKRGASVVIADLNLEAAQKAADEINQLISKTNESTEFNQKAIAIGMDVSNQEAVNQGVEKAVEQLGSIDILLSNAGIQIVSPIEDFKFEDWQKIINIHLNGAFLTTQAVIKHMYSSGRGGSIIYTGSVHSHEGSKLKSAYCAAKHGILGLSKVVAKEGATRNVRSYVVCPGFVKTPLVEKQIPEQAKELGISEEDVVKNVMLKDTFDGEFTTTGDVAEVVSFLAEFETNALSGQSFVVSHGWFMQ
jgi:3-hydroxybutyrate dehydrogenase